MIHILNILEENKSFMNVYDDELEKINKILYDLCENDSKFIELLESEYQIVEVVKKPKELKSRVCDIVKLETNLFLEIEEKYLANTLKSLEDILVQTKELSKENLNCLILHNHYYEVLSLIDLNDLHDITFYSIIYNNYELRKYVIDYINLELSKHIKDFVNTNVVLGEQLKYTKNYFKIYFTTFRKDHTMLDVSLEFLPVSGLSLFKLLYLDVFLNTQPYDHLSYISDVFENIPYPEDIYYGEIDKVEYNLEYVDNFGVTHAVEKIKNLTLDDEYFKSILKNIVSTTYMTNKLMAITFEILVNYKYNTLIDFIKFNRIYTEEFLRYIIINNDKDFLNKNSIFYDGVYFKYVEDNCVLIKGDKKIFNAALNFNHLITYLDNDDFIKYAMKLIQNKFENNAEI